MAVLPDCENRHLLSRAAGLVIYCADELIFSDNAPLNKIRAKTLAARKRTHFFLKKREYYICMISASLVEIMVSISETAASVAFCTFSDRA